MKAPYFIETLARNGDVLHRHQVDGLPIRLGRGYDNDFILDDAHAAPRHAVIEPDSDGRLVLRDLGTRNG
ncbi:MAG: FHA domain-containing protein, partial [Telluria sp.]